MSRYSGFPATNSNNGRQSMLPGASTSSQPQQVQYDSNGGVVLSAFQQRVKDKQREWEGFTKVQKQTKQLDAFMKDLGDRTDLLEHGGEAISKVVESWQNVFRATHIALAAMANRQAAGERDVNAPTLVRIPTSTAKEAEDINGRT
ncbi:MAG: hypothetical protein CYPHOPRED_000287 [Cyphobasidiales sp. Tagirdzhanova-0007]|nr:MAG: hypothetical protein CYPHOPRED_000287 [Cyphobasidiales sp. Tagirdzhanova-0007]